MIVDTLGIRREHRVCLRGITNPLFAAMVISRVDYPPSKAVSGRYDVILHQIDSPADLNELTRFANHLEAGGSVWVIHPAGEDSRPSNEAVRAVAMTAGLVASTSIPYSVTHTATRFAPRVRVTRGTI